MDQHVKVKVLDWIIIQLRKGNNCFDIDECTEDIGLDPCDAVDIEKVEEVFRWNQEQLNTFFLEGIDENT